jgi:hypothetical protein
MGLVAACALLMCVFLALLPGAGKVKGDYVRLWLPLIWAAVSAVAAGIVALMAILRRAERSILMLLPLLAADLVLLWTIGETTAYRYDRRQSFSISSSVRPLVSGVKRQTITNITTHQKP